MNVHELGEFGLIERLGARLTQRGGIELGIGDDAAILHALHAPVVTSDSLIEGVHFRRDWISPRALGRKAMAVNVSDLAATGARPVAAFVNLALSTAVLESAEALAWLDELYAGFEDIARQYDFTIAGGDTTRAPHDLSLGVTLIGEGATDARGRSTPVLRSGAAPGDALVVTGTLGDSAAGLFLLQHPQIETDEATREYLLRRHFEPTARLAEMQAALAVQGEQGARAVTAGLDLSDGLAGDAAHLARRSAVALEIETGRLPLTEYSRCVARDARLSGFDANPAHWALHGGEDYELLLGVSAESAAAVCAAITEATSTPATVVGRCLSRSEQAENTSSAVVLVHPDGTRENASGAWRHF
jgi:thiamine-monophosphate kinase